MPKKSRMNGFRRVDVQVAFFTAAVAIITCTILSTLYYNVTHDDMIRSLEDRVYALHAFIDSHIDKTTFTDINTPDDIDTTLYQTTHAMFKNVQDMTGVLYLYSGKRTDEGELVYVVDCIDPSASDFRNPGDPIEPEIVPEMVRALGGENVMPRKIKNTEWGNIFIAYLPVHADGEIVGVIGVEFEAEHQYNTYHFLLTASPFAALVLCLLCALIANRLFRRISNPLYKDMFNTDYLTNLKSRNAFNIDLENLEASKKHEGIGFYVIDLNNLKKVNDTFGHEAGDIYLQTAARSFSEAAGEHISLYRIGGDEFVLISVNDTEEKMARLTDEMIACFDRNKPQWEVPLSFAVGYALYDPALDFKLSSTYKRADAIMYERKRAFHAKNCSN